MAFPTLKVYDADGTLAFDCNDGTTTSVPPDSFDLGTAELDQTMFTPNSDGGRIVNEFLRPAVMGWQQTVIGSDVADARTKVGLLTRLLREGNRYIEWQHDSSTEIRYIDILGLSAVPSYLRGSYGIPQQYVTVTSRVEGMPVVVLRDSIRGPDLDSSANKLINSTLLHEGTTTTRPRAWTAGGGLTGSSIEAEHLQATISGAGTAFSQDYVVGQDGDWTFSCDCGVGASVRLENVTAVTTEDSPVSTAEFERVTATIEATAGDTLRVHLWGDAAESFTFRHTQLSLGDVPFRVESAVVRSDPAEKTNGYGRVFPIYNPGDAPMPANLDLTGVSGARDRILVANISSQHQPGAYMNTGKVGQLSATSILTAASEGPNDSGGSVTTTWTVPTGALEASDDIYASHSIGPGGISGLLVGKIFGFNIPPDANITGIVVEIERHGNAPVIKDNSVHLVKTGTTAVGNNLAKTALWPETDAYATYGSSSELWGTTWTPAEINATEFGVRLVAKNTQPSFQRIANVDHIRVTVHYTHYVVSGNTADANASGGDMVQTDFAGIATLSKRTELNKRLVTTGRHRVYLRAAKTVSGDSIDVQLRWALSTGTTVHTETAVALPSGTDYNDIYIGDIARPAGFPDDTLLRLEIWARRNSGTGEAKLDTLSFVPVEGLRTYDGTSNTTDVFRVDSEAGGAWQEGADFRRLDVTGPAAVMLEPGMNMIYALRASGSSLTNALADEIAVKVTGSPRFY